MGPQPTRHRRPWLTQWLAMRPSSALGARSALCVRSPRRTSSGSLDCGWADSACPSGNDTGRWSRQGSADGDRQLTAVGARHASCRPSSTIVVSSGTSIRCRVARQNACRARRSLRRRPRSTFVAIQRASHSPPRRHLGSRPRSPHPLLVHGSRARSRTSTVTGGARCRRVGDVVRSVASVLRREVPGRPEAG